MSTSAPVVLITGCSEGGIGYALCQAFARRARVVYATARRLDSMPGFPTGNVRTLKMDVCDSDSIEQAVRTIMDEQGRIDIVISNAGVSGYGPLLDITLEHATQCFNTNYFGAHRLALATIPHMAARKSGKFVIVGSMVGTTPVPWDGTYCASKAAVHTFSDILRMECAPLGVQVQYIAPGAVTSNIVKNYGEGDGFRLPEGTLYMPFAEAIYKWRSASQEKGSMPADKFAEGVVKEVMRPKLKRYFMLGGYISLFRFFMLLPRTWALAFLWRAYTR